MRRSSWIQRPATPLAVAATAAVLLAGLAGPGVLGASAAGGEAGSAPAATGTKPTTKPSTKPKPTATKPGKGVCKPGCTLVVNDFETGSQGWTGPDGYPLDVTTETAASGEQALALTRISGAEGPRTTVTSQKLARAKGQRFQVSLWFKVGGPISGKPVTLAFKGAEQAVSESVVPTGQWQALRASFVPAGATVVITVVEGPGDPCRGYPKVMQAVHVDDVTVGVPAKPVTITPTPTPTGAPTCGSPTPTPTETTPTPSPTGSWCTTCTVLRTDFEDATPQGWVSYRGSVVAATTEAAATGKYGLLAKAVRSSSGASLTIDTAVLDKRRTLTYELTAQVRVAPGMTTSPRMEFAVTGAEKVTPYPTVVTPDGWATVRTRFVPGAALSDVMTFTLRQSFMACGPDVATDVFMDDVRLWVPKDAPYPAEPAAAPKVTPLCIPPTTTRPTTTTSAPKPDLTCSAIDMPVTGGPGSTVTIRNHGPASLADWTVRMTTGAVLEKVWPGLWSQADGVVTVTSPPNEGALLAGQTLVLHLEGRNGSAPLPYPVSLNGVNCAVAMP